MGSSPQSYPGCAFTHPGFAVPLRSVALLCVVEFRPVLREEDEVGCAPAARGVPSAGRAVTRYTAVGIATLGDVAPEVGKQAQSAQRIQFRIQEPQGGVIELIQVGDNTGPLWRPFARPPDEIVAHGFGSADRSQETRV